MEDSGDAVVYPDGRQVGQPKALCKLQGYVFDAWLRMAEVFDLLDERALGGDLRRKAADLQRRFEEKFWCDDIGFYAFCLDAKKEPVRNVPQAWAAGCVFQLLQAILGLEADAPRERLYVQPELPRWLPELTLHGLSVGCAKIDLRFQRDGEQKTRWDASVREGHLEVEERPFGRQEASQTVPFASAPA